MCPLLSVLSISHSNIYPTLISDIDIHACSGVATLGHAGARAPATRGRAPSTRGRAPPVQR